MADSFEIAKGHVEVETHYDGRRVSRVSYREGHRAGTWFQRGFQHGSLRRFNKMWSVFFKPLNNLKRWLTRLRMPAIFAGLAGSALALVPALTQVASVVGTGMLPAFLGLYSTIFLVRGLLGKFATSIESQVQKKMDELGQSIKDVTAEAAKPGLNAFLKEAIRHAPILTRYVRELGEGFSDVGFAFRDLLRREENIRRIKTTTEGTARATRLWYSILDEAAEVVLVLAAAGTPLFERFTRSMIRVAHTVHDWVLLQEQTGALRRHLERSYETLEKFGRGGRDFLIGLFNIINGGVFGAEKIGDSFERWGAAFRRWTEDADNIDKVRKVIAWFVDNVGHFFRFAAAATAVQLAIAGFTKIKGLALFVRTLFALKTAGFLLFGVGSALAGLAGGFVYAYTRSEIFRDKLHKLVGEIASRLKPIFEDWWSWAKANLLPLLEELAIRGIGELGKAIHGLLDTVDRNKEGLKAWRPIILGLIKTMSILTGVAIKGMISELEGLIVLLSWVGRGLKFLYDAQQAIISFAKALPERVAGYFQAFKNVVGDAISAVAGYFSTLRDRAGRTVDHTAEAFRELPGKITGFLRRLPGALARSMEAALEGAARAVGYGIGKIVDFFVRLPGRVITTMDAFWDKMFAETKADIGKLVDFFALLPGRVMRWFDRTWDDAYDATVDWWGRTTKFLSGLPGKVGEWFQKTWASAQRTTDRWFKTILAFISGLPNRAANALVQLGPRIVRRFSESWGGAQKTSGNLVARLITFIGNIVPRAWKALVNLKNRLVNRFAEGWSAATGTSKTKVAAIINFILGIPGRAFTALRALAGRLSARAREGWNAFLTMMGNRAAAIMTYVSGIPGRILNNLRRLPGLLRESGRQLLQGLLAGVQTRIREIGGLGGWFKANLVDPIVGAVKRFFGIRSPSTVFRGIGANIVAGLWQGIAAHNPRQMIGKIFGGMPSALAKLVEKGLVQVQSLPARALKALGGLWGGIGDLFGGGGRGGGGTGGTIGNAAIAWKMLQAAFGLPMGGWRATGSVPGSDHPKGLAIDVMTSNYAAHQAIIAFARAALPGLKYWISMRRIATASGGWKVRPYSGPSPHTDHVHLSFFRQGKNRLPEDILGFGKSGRGYVMHKGEQVVRRNQTVNNNDQGLTINGGIHIHVDAKDIQEMQDVIRIVRGVRSTAKQAGVRTRVA